MARSKQERRRAEQRQPPSGPVGGDPAERRRRLVGLGVILAMLLGTVGAVIAATAADDPTPTTSTTTPTAAPPTTSAPGELPPVDDVPLPEPGATVGADYPCPAPDGSAERVTTFGGPPPMCLETLPDGTVDPAVTYRATLRTSVGDLVFLLDTERSPLSVNDFVVLARYHYFDGAPFDTVWTRGWAELGGAFTTGREVPAGGFTIPGEAPEVGTVPFPGALGIYFDDPEATTSQGGRFLVVTGEQAAALPERTTFLGLLLDGTDAFPDLITAGTSSGVPSSVITVEAVSVEATRDPGAGDDATG